MSEPSGADRAERPDEIRAARRRRRETPDRRGAQARGRALRYAEQAAIFGIFFFLFISALMVARPILLPAVSAFVVAMMLGPLSARAHRLGVPSLVTALVLWLLVIAVFYGLIVLLTTPAVTWIDKAPDIGRSLQEKLRVFDRPLASLQELRNALLPEDDADVGFDIMAVVQPVVGFVTPAVGQIIIFFGTLFFLLLGRDQLRHMVVALFRNRPARLHALKIMNDIEFNLTSYLSVMTVINVGVGIGAGTVAWLVGLPDPLAWGVLGFVLNFIPYVGALMMELAMFLVGLVTFPTLTHALIAPLLYLAFSTLEGHFITPSVVGRRFTLNPLTVFLALVFWTWLWGPVGAFLAVPLLVMSLAAFAHLYPRREPELPD